MSQEIICTGRVPRLLLPDRGLEKHYPVNVVTQNSKGKSYRMPLLLIPSISAPEIISSVRAHRTNYDNTCQALDSLEILTPEMLPTCESIPKTDEMNMSYFRLDEAINDAEKQEYDNNSTANGMRYLPCFTSPESTGALLLLTVSPITFMRYLIR